MHEHAIQDAIRELEKAHKHAKRMPGWPAYIAIAIILAMMIALFAYLVL